MPKLQSVNSDSITVSIQPKTEEYRQVIAPLKKDLQLIARKTVSGGVTELTLLMWNQLVEKCRRGIAPFDALEEVTASMAEQFEKSINETMPRR